jgi:Helix-turn-helix domain
MALVLSASGCGSGLRYDYGLANAPGGTQPPAGAVPLRWGGRALARRGGRASAALRGHGKPLLKYVARWRMDVAAQFLQSGEGPVREAAERVGYTAEAAFRRAFKRAFGLPPSAYRRAAARAGA